MLVNYIHTFLHFIYHTLTAKGSHDLHSPFVYQLYTQVIKKLRSGKNDQIEYLKAKAEKDQSAIKQIDFKYSTSKITTVAHIAKTSSSSSKFSVFLSGLSTLLNTQYVLETGTSLGFNALYQSLPKHVKKVISIEGNPEIVKVAKENLDAFRSKKVEIIQEDVYKSFSQEINNHNPDLIFLDADHRPEALEFYLDTLAPHFNQIKCIVIHDIYWSKSMTDCWKGLIKKDTFTLTLDIFEAGLLFPHYPIEKQHFRLKF